MRVPIIAGNWKMYKTVPEALKFVDQLLPLVQGIQAVEIVLCSPFTALYSLGQRLQGWGIGLGAQDVFWEEKGAFTGEISPSMLRDTGCRYVIIGHSERRHVLGETDEMVNKKLKGALSGHLCPIMCVGETLEQRQAGRARWVVKAQLQNGLQEVEIKGPDLIVAYEPVWAIGTGINASPDDAQEMIGFIRMELAGRFGEQVARQIRILYGGSVKEDNIGGFMVQPDIDGALVGGASLEAVSLAGIVKRTEDSADGR